MRSIHRPLTGALVAATAAAWACAGGARLGSPTDYQMWLHFREAGEIQAAMIRGDLSTAREASRILADAPAADGLGPDAEADVRELQAWARTIRDAASFGAAAEATGHLAATCGECHADVGGGPIFLQGDPPSDRGFSGHMILHSWAADRMWEGLLAPAPATWRDGAEVFREEPLTGGGLTPEAIVFAQRLHALGREAEGIRDLRRQAVVYGQILEQCAGCHAEMGVSR